VSKAFPFSYCRTNPLQPTPFFYLSTSIPYRFLLDAHHIAFLSPQNDQGFTPLHRCHALVLGETRVVVGVQDVHYSLGNVINLEIVELYFVLAETDYYVALDSVHHVALPSFDATGHESGYARDRVVDEQFGGIAALLCVVSPEDLHVGEYPGAVGVSQVPEGIVLQQCPFFAFEGKLDELVQIEVRGRFTALVLPADENST